LCFFLFSFSFFNPCIINSIITILLSLFSPCLLSLLLLYYNPLFSLPTTLSAHYQHSFHCLHLPLSSSPNLSPMFPSTYSLPADYSTVPTAHKHCPLQSLTQTPSTTIRVMHPNTHKDHKTQQPPYLLNHKPTPFPTPSFLVPLLPIPQNL
jgi:hypothetical protein